jgi:hypothetical protein
VIQAPDNTLLNFLERFAVTDPANGESSVHHFVSQGVNHVLGIPLPNGYREVVKRKTTKIFQILDNGDLHAQSTNADMFWKVHRVL